MFQVNNKDTKMTLMTSFMSLRKCLFAGYCHSDKGTFTYSKIFLILF